MERKGSVGSSSVPSLAASEMSTGKESASSGKSTSSGLFSSVFPPASTVMGRDSSRSDIFGPFRKHDSAGGVSQGSAGKGHNCINKDTNSVYQSEQTGHCFLGSSLYYGGQDVCAHPPASHTYRLTDKYKKDVEDNSGSSRGDWWEGSLYY